MSKYEIYKPSGIDWIGEVPNHWHLKRLKNIVLNDIGGLWGDEPADDENDIIVLRVADFDRTNSRIIDNPEFTYRNIRASQLEGRLIKQGDILLEKSGGGEQQPVGKAVLFDKDFRAVTSNFINKIETIPSVNNHFALYLFDALYYNNINVRNIKQTTGIQNLDNTGFFSENISLPPTAEQITIANYLDDQTQKIDRLIANKKAQAEKLKELRQIEINNAVTKGLNPSTELKDSGIDWLGVIPKLWQTNRLKNVTYINQEVISEKTSPDFEIKYIDIGNVTSNGEFLELQEMTFSDAPSRARRKPKHNSIILSTVRTYLRAIAFVQNPDENLITSTGFAVIDAYENLFDAKYLFYQMTSHIVVERVIASSDGVSYPAISSTKLGDLKIILPPKQEQELISKYLDKRTSAIDKLINNIDAQIEKLQEVRKIKIYEAVTGKIKVITYVEATA